jgi:hypothetical protein
MLEFFTDGGFVMYPILIVGSILLVSGVLYAIDCEPVRLRLITALSLVLFGFSLQGIFIDASVVFNAVATHKFPNDDRITVLLMGMKESTRPLIFGLALWSLALVCVAIGVYRSSQRELRAARG